MATSPAYSRFTARLPSLPSVVAFVTLVVLVIRAIHTVDPYWDTLAYHWPFAARVSGLCDRDCYEFLPSMERRYDGFPLLLHAAQGVLWRLTGTPGMGDMVNIGMVLALSAYLRYRFCVPVAWSWLGFLAIPEVQIHLTSSYIDLPANAAATVALLVVLRMLVQPATDQRTDVAIALAALAIAANGKYQMIPISLLAWFTIVLLATRNPSMLMLRTRVGTFAILSIAGALVLLPKLIINAFAFGDPFYPVAASIGPIHWSGPEGTIAGNSVSDFWRTRPGWLRWLGSVLEFDAFRGRPLPWTLGQGDVPQSNQSYHVGGYFVAYVLGAIALLWWNCRGSRQARWAGALVVVLSLICAFLPASHELRYYMFWMLTLVACILAVAYCPAFAGPQQNAQRQAAHVLVSVAFASVVMMTGAAYLKTPGQSIAGLVRETNAVVAQIPDGGTICVLNGSRSTFFFASIFHAPRRYHTRALWGDEKAECTVRLDLPP